MSNILPENQKTTKNRVGRPIVYRDSMCNEIIKLMAEGTVPCEVCAKWNISEEELEKWMKEHEEFKDAYNKGIAKCKAWWVDIGRQGLKGELKSFKFQLWQQFMISEFKWNKNTPDAPKETTTVNINSMNVMNSDKQLVEFIRAKLQLHQDKPAIATLIEDLGKKDG